MVTASNDRPAERGGAMKSAATILSGLGLLAATYAAGPAMAADHPTASHASQSAAGTWWQPANSGPDNGPEWQWELDHPLRVGNAADMGVAATNTAGQVAANPTVSTSTASRTPHRPS